MLGMIWKLVRIYAGKFLALLYKLFKAQLRALLWKWGSVFVLMALTACLAYLVLRP